MKNLLLILIISLLCCTKSDNEIRKKMLIKYYGLDFLNQKYSEEIIVINKKKSNDLEFVYKYKNLKDDNDTLFISKDSILLNNIKLSFSSEKTYMYNNKKYKVKKYMYNDNKVKISDIYINDSDGFILYSGGQRSQFIVEYYPNKNIEGIHEKIINDSLFFEKWYH